LKLVGFVRLLPLSPAPVLPVFRQEGAAQLHLQKIGPSGLVEDFVPIDSPPNGRLIVTDEPSFPEMTVGEVAILALDRGEADIALRRGHRYLESIRELLHKRADELTPFMALELAVLVGDRHSAVAFGRKCLSEMASLGPRLAASWLAGAAISDDLRRELSSDPIVNSPVFDLSDQRWLVSFQGPKLLVRGLTQFCTSVLRQPRATVIRNLFDTSKSPEIPLPEHVDAVTGAVLWRANRAVTTELFLLRVSASWGRVLLADGVDPNWLNEDYENFETHLLKSSNIVKLRRSGIDLSFGRARVLLYIWAALEKMTGKAAAAIREMPVVETHGDYELKHAVIMANRLRGSDSD